MADVTLYFADSGDGGSAIQRFEIQYRSGSEAWAATRQVSATGSPHTVPGLTLGTEYEFRVRAVNAVGNGEWSESVSASPVTSLGIPLGTIRVYIGEPDDGGAPITGYHVQWRRASENWAAARQALVTATAEYWERAGFAFGATYYIRARAFNAEGDGPWSAQIAVTLSVPPPVEGPDVEGPDVEGPDVEGPDDEGPDDEGPDDEGPDDEGPDIEGPDVEGPDVEGPDVEGPDITGRAENNVTFTMAYSGTTVTQMLGRPSFSSTDGLQWGDDLGIALPAAWMANGKAAFIGRLRLGQAAGEIAIAIAAQRGDSPVVGGPHLAAAVRTGATFTFSVPGYTSLMTTGITPDDATDPHVWAVGQTVLDFVSDVYAGTIPRGGSRSDIPDVEGPPIEGSHRAQRRFFLVGREDVVDTGWVDTPMPFSVSPPQVINTYRGEWESPSEYDLRVSPPATFPGISSFVEAEVGSINPGGYGPSIAVSDSRGFYNMVLRAAEGPDIEGPDVEGPDVEGPDVEGPDDEGPDDEGPDDEGPDIEGPDVEGPDVEGPDVEGPDVEGPDVEGPDVEGPDQDWDPATQTFV